MSMDVYGRYVNRLSIQDWADEKIWSAKQTLFESESPNVGQTSGQVIQNNKTYTWQLTVQATSQTSKAFELYVVQLTVHWPEGKGSGSLFRSSYVVKPKKTAL